MNQRVPWHLGVTALAAGALLLACQQQPTTPSPAQPKAGATTPIATVAAPAKQAAPASPVAKAASPAPAAKAAASPAPVAKAASPAPVAKAAASPRAEPKGTMTYGWHTAIAPAWMDPQENPALITPYAFDYALHDALVKPMPGNVFTPSLAESYTIAPDFKSATFKLRPNIKFHNGEPVTPQDVIFTFQNYKGANAKILHDKTEKVEAVDAQTVKFTFKTPFLDFLTIYGTPASGAGWIVPAKYYQEVGPDAFKTKPIGAGPYKFVRQTGTDYEFEAFTDYWRKAPNIKTLVYKALPEGATRVAALQTGEIDAMNLLPGELIETVQADPKLQIAPIAAAVFWLEFPGYEKPASPFNNPKVREAVSLALDRQALSDAETAGFSPIVGNWIPDDWPGALKAPAPPYNLDRAKQLMAEAGFPDGFDAGQITPLPPYFSLGERIIGQLGAIGIRTTLNQMERAAFASKLSEGAAAFDGGIILNISGSPGDAAGRVRAFGICPPAGASSRTCDPQIDEKFKKYESSTDQKERETLLADIQQYILDNNIFVPVYRLGFVNAQGSRIANEWDAIWGTIPQYVYIGPYEDVLLKE